MPLQIIDCEQGSTQWDWLRCGMATSSRFTDVLAKGRGGEPSKTRAGYLNQIVGERLTEQVDINGFYDSNMRWGNERQPQAMATYLFESDALNVHVPGFCQLNDYVGASTDGLVGDDGILEIKCPMTKNHIATVLSNKVPTKYITQIQGGLWVTGREWCDFVSFDPRLRGKASYFCIRIMRDETKIKQIEAEVNVFVADLLGLLKRLNDGHESHRLYIS